MAVLLSENFTLQQFNTNFNIDEILKVQTLAKPSTFAEINLMKIALKRWQMFVCSRRLLKQYFNKWNLHHKMASESQNESTVQKIDTLISELHRMKTKRKKFIRSNSDAVGVKKQKGNVVTEAKNVATGSECFKNRFKTQKDIIVLQKAKLEEQSRIIQDLKLGIIKDELSKSLEHTKVELKQIFSKSPNNKLKNKMASSSGIKIEDTLATFIVSSSKAPKFLQQMERRALERARNREIIRERKRLIDEEKQRIFEEALEQKRQQDEEEKRRNLEAIKERQREELERQKIIQANKEKYFADLKKAISFYKRRIIRRCFWRLQHNVYIARNNVLKAESLYEKSLKQYAFKCWKKNLVVKYQKENEKADEFFKKLALSKSFDCWKSVRQTTFFKTQLKVIFNLNFSITSSVYKIYKLRKIFTI